jgi:hypothetical protein
VTALKTHDVESREVMVLVNPEEVVTAARNRVTNYQIWVGIAPQLPLQLLSATSGDPGMNTVSMGQTAPERYGVTHHRFSAVVVMRVHRLPTISHGFGRDCSQA